MIIGIDFDNTIINYDEVFYQFALKSNLINSSTPKQKVYIKNKIIKNFSEKKWTQLQGKVYSKGIFMASIFDDCLNTMHKLDKNGHKIIIISHKTKYPVLGEKFNLHINTKIWIKKNILEKKNFKNFSINDVHFNQTQNQKIKKILDKNCDIFIDDLEKVLFKLPENIFKIIFVKRYTFKKNVNLIHIGNWKTIFSTINAIS